MIPYLGIGVGLRREHYARVLDRATAVDWFEVISENFMGSRYGRGGKPLRVLEEVSAAVPVVLHGVSLSLGSIDALDEAYLERLEWLCGVARPPWISDHLCWTGVDGENNHDLLPLPLTREAADHVARRIDSVQQRLGLPFLVENISSYLRFDEDEMTEWEFISRVVAQADCGILLDLNNIYVNSVNHGFSPEEFLRGIPSERVGQFHLAGHRRRGRLLVDTHDGPVSEKVWALYDLALRLFGRVSTLIEWDADVPAFERLEGEVARARCIQEEVFGRITTSPEPRRIVASDAGCPSPS